MEGYKYCIQLAFLYIAAVEIGGLQRFAEVPSYTEVNPGEDALLKCRIFNKKGICSWQKDNKPVGMYRGKYEWANIRYTIIGDCSLLVRSAKLQIDDGQWQCQVTSSYYDVQDALSSPPAALAIRVAPQSPKILFNGSWVLFAPKITLASGSRATVACEVRHGNPPAYIEWYLEKRRFTPWCQTNTSDVDQSRLWVARSVLDILVTRSAHGKQLTCRAHHPSYPAPFYRNAFAMLDITFIPVVSIVGADGIGLSSLEEGLSNLSLNCRADGNPKPYVWWTKDGQEVATNGPKFVIASVTRNHSGIYGCQAKNSLGTSDSVKIAIDVKFAPYITRVGPDKLVEAKFNSQVTMECKAYGNPSPSYLWYHCPWSIATNNKCIDDYLISSAPRLQLFNVSYSQRGRYVCIAKNFIGLHERTHQSEAITLNVLGPPVGSDGGVIHGWRGDVAKVQTTVCANPPPKTAYWLWSHLRFDVPSEFDRHKALEKEIGDYCYVFALSIIDVQVADAGDYMLCIKNDMGFSSYTISFIVHETAHVAPLIAAALAITALMVLLLFLIVWFRRRRDGMEYKNYKLHSVAKVLPMDAKYTHQALCISGTRRKFPSDSSNFSPNILKARHAGLILKPHAAM